MWWDGVKLKPDFSRAPAATELYFHGRHNDAFDGENQNVASDNPGVLETMMGIAKAQWM